MGKDVKNSEMEEHREAGTGAEGKTGQNIADQTSAVEDDGRESLSVEALKAELEKAQRQISKLNKENEEKRRKAKEAKQEEERKRLEEQGKYEEALKIERQRVAEMEARMQKIQRDAEIRAALMSAGANMKVKPDWISVQDDQPVEAAVAEFLKEFPQFKGNGAGHSAPQPGKSAVMSDLDITEDDKKTMKLMGYDPEDPASRKRYIDIFKAKASQTSGVPK